MSKAQEMGADKTAPTPAKRGKGILATAIAKSNDIKAHEGKVNPPKFVTKGKNHNGQKMKDIFESGILKNVDFRDADLRGADFTWIEEITNAKTKVKSKVIRGFVIQGCDFRGAQLDDADFRHCDLRWSRFDNMAQLDAAITGDFDEDGNLINNPKLKEVDGITR